MTDDPPPDKQVFWPTKLFETELIYKPEADPTLIVAAITAQSDAAVDPDLFSIHSNDIPCFL